MQVLLNCQNCCLFAIYYGRNNRNFCAIFSREKVDEGIIESMIEEDNREQNEQMEEYGLIDN